jgi:putative ABC transport system permease protein
MLVHSKLRSWLTILGIFIGIAAVVAIISLGQGLQQSVNSQIQGLGQDIITISSGSSRAFGGGEGRAAVNVKTLSDKDIQALKLVPGIKAINGIVSGRVTIKYQSESTSSSIQGSNPDLFNEFTTSAIQSGRYLSQGDAKSVIIGDRLATNVFKTSLGAGSIITINDKPFKIIGILAPSSSIGGGSDNGIYMTIKDAREVLGNTTSLKSDEYSSISIKVNDPNYINETSNSIEEALMNSHHVAKDKEDFSITSALALQERFSSITGGITLFLGVIAAVSLLVGGIGVANTMFTSVMEKTRDIGVMKAIGATNSDILLIFLFNSGMLGLVGGLLGIMFSIPLALLIPYLGVRLGFGASGSNFTIPINVGLLAFAVAFSITIGMISGAIPAYRASKLKPVDALRYE